MKIAVTGTSGNIGRAIVEMALAQGHSLVCIDRVVPDDDTSDTLKFVQADMSEYDKLVEAFAGCDGLIHMAAIPSPGRHPDHIVHNNNVVGSYNALRAAVEQGIKRICQASSVNAIGHSYSRKPRYDNFPIDETHANYSEDPYSLSKWICEAQGDSFARRYEDIAISSLRFHMVVPERSDAVAIYANNDLSVDHHLWAWTGRAAAADASIKCLEAPFKGHEAFYIVAPDTAEDTPSQSIAAQQFPNVPITGDLGGNRSFFSAAKAERLLGWRHADAQGK
ncbi:NAD(P)-dependent oxidoreductase [Devosia rhodophyticola]|uniref:NAD(P)-dependent oxidoreductase n=1 Tax=Devosia rhodophyticola TaxID=3026423 RepID=A0ABY7YT44_9HYPH|nr:NAD(P)-dependent oxidoreductase [Devosia rhodophyticola]WDR04508.1 NAD(P)-dependent oxidoreductase [Devosia rhodophyticola]